jgi:hypothetical protein
MKNSREDYASPSEWLAELKQDKAWLTQLHRLQSASVAEMSAYREDAVGRILKSLTFFYWNLFKHAEPAVEEVWGTKLSLPMLKMQTICVLTIEWIEKHSKLQSGNELPEQLASEEAKKYWRRLQKAGFVDINNKLLTATTRQQAMYIAEVFAERMNIKSKWKTFQQFWGINNLAQEKNKFLETGKLPSRSNEIDTIFEE